jgi:hypothetical protein
VDGDGGDFRVLETPQEWQKRMANILNECDSSPCTTDFLVRRTGNRRPASPNRWNFLSFTGLLATDWEVRRTEDKSATSTTSSKGNE